MQSRPFTEKIFFCENLPFNSEGLKTDVNAAHFSTFGLTQTIGNQKWKFQMYNKKYDEFYYIVISEDYFTLL